MQLQDERFLAGDDAPARQSVRHGFFTRRGGVSQGLYDSLNCALNATDDPLAVRENRARVAEALSGSRETPLLTVKQIHSPTCVIATSPWTPEDAPEADAIATQSRGVILGALSADCGPVLFSGITDCGQPVIAAAHAGWGGALKGVLESTVLQMIALGAELDSIRASVGPCIGPASYEVQPDFARPFLERDAESDRFFRPGRKEDALHFDLPGYIAWRLAICGVKHISITGLDTYPDEARFFSFRRATHRGEAQYGRQLSAIMIA